MRVHPYLHFNGQCEAAFKFYEKCLGGKIQAMIPHEGTPAAGQVPAEWRSKIMHASVVVDDQVLMGCDAPRIIFRNLRASPFPSRSRNRRRRSAYLVRWRNREG